MVLCLAYQQAITGANMKTLQCETSLRLIWCGHQRGDYKKQSHRLEDRPAKFPSGRNYAPPGRGGGRDNDPARYLFTRGDYRLVWRWRYY